MKTSEFLEVLKSQDVEYEYDEYGSIIISRGDQSVGWAQLRGYDFYVDGGSLFDDIVNLGEYAILARAIAEYATTNIEDRVDSKRYCIHLRDNLLKFSSMSYLNKSVNTGEISLGSQVDIPGYKFMFTKEEINDIRVNLGISSSDWEVLTIIEEV